MKKYFLAFIIVLAFACKRKEKPSKDMYTVPQMAAFLKDIHIIEASMREVRASRDSTERVYKMLEDRLYEKHNMNDSIYQLSYAFYLEHPEYMTQIYAIVADSLGLEERLVEREVEEKKKREEEEKKASKDSLSAE